MGACRARDRSAARAAVRPEEPEPEPLPHRRSLRQRPRRRRAPPAVPKPAPAAPAAARAAGARACAALRRGARSVDAAIDLHGMRQERGAWRAPALSCTGAGAGPYGGARRDRQGRRGPDGDGSSRSAACCAVSVPHWLRLPDLRPLVVGFEEAAQHHGGAGALYVRLRRPRPGAQGNESRLTG